MEPQLSMGEVPKYRVAVVTPVVRFPLSSEEEISIRHLRAHLAQFDRYIIGLQNLPAEFSDFKLQRFPTRYFIDRYGYNRLVLMKEFYRAFAEYEYILIYQLDSLVFASNLEEWCGRGWDYVGAPWLVDAGNPRKGFSAVGNGGLSLRRVQRALEVLSSNRLWEDPKTRGRRPGRRSEMIHENLGGGEQVKRLVLAGKTFLHSFGYHNNVRWLTKKMARDKRYEDLFWAYEARKLVRDFRIPAVRQALKFSFEMAPRYCFEKNGGRLPFGCHAWARYDRGFWEPYLLK